MEQKPEEGASAVAMLCDLRGGKSVLELDSSLAELVDAVRRTGKAGTLTLRLNIRPASKGRSDDDVQVVMIEDAISVKAPQLERGASIFFAGIHGELTRRDPRQLTIDDVRNVEPAPAPAPAPDPAPTNVASIQSRKGA